MIYLFFNSSAFRLLPSAFRLLPSAFCLPPSAFCLLPSAFRLPPSAFRLLYKINYPVKYVMRVIWEFVNIIT
jgi:hypothetical protein